MKYNVGDRVRVVDNLTNHKFKIGQEVTVIKLQPWNGRIFSCRGDDGESWAIMNEEVEPEELDETFLQSLKKIME